MLKNQMEEKMIDEIVKEVVKKTGLPADKAKVVVELVIDLLKQKLPEPVADQIDAAVSGKGADLDAATGMIGSLFGKK
jgi:hypothetical protein